jgi:hypothetical protein
VAGVRHQRQRAGDDPADQLDHHETAGQQGGGADARLARSVVVVGMRLVARVIVRSVMRMAMIVVVIAVVMIVRVRGVIVSHGAV